MNNSKLLKTFSYIFSIGVIVFIVLTMSKTDLPGIGIVKMVCLGVCGVICLFFLYLFVYCLVDNKNIDRLADTDQYEQLINYINKRVKQKLYLVPERMSFYNYYLLLSYLMLENDEKAEELFEKEKRVDSFPVILYWKASYELSKGIKENVANYYELFKLSHIISKYQTQYINVANSFECLYLYSQGKIEEAYKALKNVNERRIHLPATKKVLNIIKESVTEENL